MKQGHLCIKYGPNGVQDEEATLYIVLMWSQ